MFYHFAGARISIMIGSTMCSIGFAAGSFVHSLWLLCVCMLFFGLGTGLMRNAIISVQCEYFKTAQHRNTVHAFMTIGPGLGIWLMPRLLVYIIKEYSWQIAWQALSTLYIVSFIMGIFISRRPSDENSSIWSMTGIKIWNKLEFCLHAICTFCAAACSIIYISNILILMRNENIPEPEKVYSYQGIASIAGKGLLTLLMSFNKIDIAWLIIACYVIAQTALFSGAFCYSLWQFRLQNFFSGFGIGLFQAALVPFLVALVGATQLPAALGFTNLVSGLAAFSAINIAGRVAKEYDDERRPFVISMFLGSIAIVLAIINSLLHKFRKSHVRRPSMKQYSRVNGVKNLSEITSFEGQ
ncbi:hypothetical protein WR25_23308 isoform H [Diploscapter pachys]|nr:hypothetical protein WR25_23308 isoform B [Diploscapter pachys]PAV57690.1 hypothetical protein WR25_23308 isoform H [Diploscapter pachys]